MTWTHIKDTLVRGCAAYPCVLCGLRIRKGARHVFRFGFSEAGPERSRIHEVCESVASDWQPDDWESSCDFGTFRTEELDLPLLTGKSFGG